MPTYNEYVQAKQARDDAYGMVQNATNLANTAASQAGEFANVFRATIKKGIAEKSPLLRRYAEAKAKSATSLPQYISEATAGAAPDTIMGQVRSGTQRDLADVYHVQGLLGAQANKVADIVKQAQDIYQTTKIAPAQQALQAAQMQYDYADQQAQEAYQQEQDRISQDLRRQQIAATYAGQANKEKEEIDFGALERARGLYNSPAGAQLLDYADQTGDTRFIQNIYAQLPNQATRMAFFDLREAANSGSPDYTGEVTFTDVNGKEVTVSGLTPSAVLAFHRDQEAEMMDPIVTVRRNNGEWLEMRQSEAEAKYNRPDMTKSANEGRWPYKKTVDDVTGEIIYDEQ
jgi:hypothetical protein